MPEHRRRLDRIEETRGQLTDLRSRVTTWFETRRAHDKQRQYWTQLTALENVLQPRLHEVQSEVEGIQNLTRTGDVYAACRLNDRRIQLLDRYWRYFGDKWDQRDDVALGATLRAADEVVWSCWAEPFTIAGEAVAAAPLPYLEPFHTPRAIPRTSLPPDVRRADELLRAALEVLPVPLISLPPVVHGHPWWLAALAHEVGHHIQRDLRGGAFHAGLATVVDDVAVTAGAEVGCWGGWHEELFADVCSVLLIGPAAAVATMELLRTADTSMLTETSAYPSSAVRRFVLDGALTAAGSPIDARAPGFRPDGLDELALDAADEPLRATASTRLRAVPRVVAAVLDRPLVDGRTLRGLSGWDPVRHRPGHAVTFWRDALVRPKVEPVPETQLHSARTVLAGSVAAWQAIGEKDDAAARTDARQLLAARMRSLLPQCRPPGKRAGREAVAPDVEAAQKTLTHAVFGAAIEADP